MRFAILLLAALCARAEQKDPILIRGFAHEPYSNKALTDTELVALVKEKNFRTSEDVLRYLKADERYRNYLVAPVLMYTKESSQSDRAAKAKEDPERPYFRHIFGGDGLTLALNTNPKSPHYNQLEMAQWDPKQPTKFRFSKFNLKDQTLEDDQECRSCHGKEPTPLWGAYPLWPGAIAGASGTLVFKDKQKKEYFREGQLFEAFQKHRGEGLFAYFTYADKFRELNPGTEYPFRVLETDPSALLNTRLSRLNYKRVLARLHQWPGYQRYRWAIIAALVNCPSIESYLPKEVAEEHQARIIKDFPPVEQVLNEMRKRLPKFTVTDALEMNTRDITQAERKRRAEAWEKLHPGQESLGTNFDTGDIEPVAKLRYLLEGAGQVMRDWSLSRAPGEDTFSYTFMTGQHGLRDLLDFEILPEINARAEYKSVHVENPSQFFQKTAQGLKPYCEALKKMSETAFAQWKANPQKAEGDHK